MSDKDNEATIESFEIHETLTVSYKGKKYFLETKENSEFIAKNKIKLSELSELKKLKCNLFEHLTAKFVLEAEVKETRILNAQQQHLI